MKGDKSIKSSTFSKMRKRLSDISNLHSQHKSPFKNQENVLPAPDNSSSKIYMEKILQENAVMKKLIEEKDKIIESNGVELQKLRVNLQKTQLQNWHLAQSNSQMLAELNMAKDRLKNLQHELLSKNALSKAMTLELKEKAKVHCKTNGFQEGEPKPEEAAMEQPLKDNENKVSKTKRERPARSQSMGPTTSQQAVDKETVENKRRCLRRQSVRLKPPGKQDDLFEIEVGKDAANQTIHFSRRKSTSDKADDEEYLSESSNSTRAQRSSIGRPQRRVTEKVQSYKDPPLNKKMRRPA
ncbi:SHUGOSHIN 2-like [Chenopodium quinoa]|uniref:SHUGOSHIN 2-like n=1 Tax=Chenopodium quinoa TaxID=63459 RepID=UPI000B779D9D|nr:SHUGOSHIN 2-like [Chenopodium quinoa]